MPENTATPDENGWIRVTDKDTGHRLSVRESALPHGNYTVLKAKASDPLTGDPLPPEHRDAGAPTVTAAAKSTRKRSTAKKAAAKPLSSTTTSGQSAEPKKES